MHAFANVLLESKKSWAVDEYEHFIVLRGSIELVTCQMNCVELCKNTSDAHIRIRS